MSYFIGDGGHAGERHAGRGRALGLFRSTRCVPLRLELLEDRTCPSTLPTPTVTGQTDVMDNANGLLVTPPFPSTNDFGTTLNRSAPQVVADPLNPNKLVAVWVVNSVDLLDTPTQIKGPVVEGAFSTDGGTTWHTITWRTTSADLELNAQGTASPPDFSAFSPMNYPIGTTGLSDPRNELLRDPAMHYLDMTHSLDIYGQWIDPSVAFDRQENFYIVSIQAQQSSSPGTITTLDASGAVILQKFNFSGSAPVRKTLAATLNPNPGSKFPAQVDTKVLYQWTGVDSAITPVIVVDTNVRTYTDPTTGAVQLDPTVDATSGLGPIYVTWSTHNTAPQSTTPNPFFNPDAIKVLVSSDGGNSFSSQVYVNQGAAGNPGGSVDPNLGSERDLVPQIAVSQGTPTSGGAAPRVPGGQVNLVWHDSNPTVGSPVPSTENKVVTNAIPGGGAGFQFDGGVGNINFASMGKMGGNTPAQTTFTDTVAFTPAQSSLTFTKLDVTLAIVHPHLSHLLIQLSHGNTTVTLVLNGVNSSGTPIMPTQGLADNGGNNGLGVLTYKDVTGMFIVDVEPVGATFDDQAPRSIIDMKTPAAVRAAQPSRSRRN